MYMHANTATILRYLQKFNLWRHAVGHYWQDVYLNRYSKTMDLGWIKNSGPSRTILERTSNLEFKFFFAKKSLEWALTKVIDPSYAYENL